MLVAILFLLTVIFLLIFFVPPFHWSIILFLITLISQEAFLIIRFLNWPKKTSFLISAFIFISLSLMSLKVFDPVNIILLISIFIGIFILTKNH